MKGVKGAQLTASCRAFTVEREQLAEQNRPLVEARDDLHSRLSVIAATSTWRTRARVLTLPRVAQAPVRLALRSAQWKTRREGARS